MENSGTKDQHEDGILRSAGLPQDPGCESVEETEGLNLD